MCIEARIRIRQSGKIPLIKLVTIKLLYTFVLEIKEFQFAELQG